MKTSSIQPTTIRYFAIYSLYFLFILCYANPIWTQNNYISGKIMNTAKASALTTGSIWTLVQRKSDSLHYDKWHYWLPVLVRYRVAIGIIDFGYLKLFRMQMAIIHQDAIAFAKGIESASVQLIDVRTPSEYTEGHIAKSTLIDWKDQEKFQLAVKNIDKNQPVYLYCRSGKRSTDAGNYLIKQGFKQVFNLEGGVQSWQASGKKIEK